MKLICAPFAGAIRKDFDSFISCFGEEWEVCLIDYPGHGSRRREPYAKNFSELAEKSALQVTALLVQNEPYVLMGYSMGSIVVYEMVVRGLVPAPKLLVEASHRPPNLEWASKSFVHLDDRDFWKQLKKLGAMGNVQESFLENKVYRRMFFDPIREDYRIISTYQRKMQKIHGVPAICFYSPSDVPEEEMNQWKLFFENEADFYQMGENHFFLYDHYSEMAAIIQEQMKNQLDTKKRGK